MNSGASQVTIDGPLTVNVSSDRNPSIVTGIRNNTVFNSVGDGSQIQPTYQGGFIKFNGDLNVNITSARQGYAIVSGSDFGNNGNGGGLIELNGNSKITVETTNAGTEDFPRSQAIGMLAWDEGKINVFGKQHNITVNGFSDGKNNHEIAGIYASFGGHVNGSETSNFTIDVTGKNNATIYGISAGYYDQLDANKQGTTEVNLKGKNIISLHNGAKSDARGIDSSMKANVTLGTADIRFMNANAANSNWLTGLRTQTAGKITTDSLYIGTNGSAVTDPTKITAIQTAGRTDLYRKDYGSSGTITINDKGTGTVQVNGQVKAVDAGTINLNLTNKDSYLYGNTRVVTYNNEGTINVTLDNGAKWTNVRGDYDLDSEITNLNLNNGAIIDMTDTKYVNKTKHGIYQSIYIDKDMKGTKGTIHMDIDATTNTDNSDRLYIKGTHTGEHYITLNNIGAGNDGAKGTVLVSVNDEQGSFKANDAEGTLYWNKYTLASKESEDTTGTYHTDWYLDKATPIAPPDKPTTTVDTNIGSYGLNYFTWRDMDKLMQRMGDLRHNGEEEKGIWFRIKRTKLSRSNQPFSFKNTYTLYQLGYDKIKERDEQKTKYNGLALFYGEGDGTFIRGAGDTSSWGMSLYSTEMRRKGHYLDLILQLGRYETGYHVYDTKGQRITADLANFGISASAEYGRKKKLDDNGWYIEPQGQLTLGRMLGDSYWTSNGVRVDQKGITSLVGRAGVNFGRDINKDTNVYVKLNVLHEFLGDYSVTMTDKGTGQRVHYDSDFGDTWLEYGLGLAVKVNDDTNLYADVEKSTGGDVRKNWSWNAGIRWNF